MESRKKPIGDGPVGVDTAVSKEWPVAAHFLHLADIALNDENFFAIMRAFGKDSAKRIAHEGRAPEFETFFRRTFEADTIYGCHVDAVGDRVCALRSAPGIVLSLAELCLFGGMPADRGGVEQNIRAGECGEAGGLGIPLVPADERRYASEFRVEGAETEIARSEIELLEKERVVGDVHLAVDAEQGSVGIDDRGRVVIKTRCAFFKQ